MTKKNVYISMYRALDCLYDETQREDLGNYLSEANPYLFIDRNSADPAIFAGFSDYFDSFHNKNDISAEEGYVLVKNYLRSEHMAYYGKFEPLFEDVSLDEWADLCRIVEVEESVQI